MSVLTATPAPVPMWVQEAYFPSFTQTDGDLVLLNKNRWAYRAGYLNDPTTSGPMIVDGPSAAGGGSLKRHELALGVAYALRYSGPSSDCWRVPFIPSAINPAATIGHLITREDFRVVWYRIPIADVGGPGDGTCGHVWSWDDAGVVGINWAQGGSAVQQHGIYGNGAGGVEYRSYSSAPALLETVALPGYTPGQWNTCDHVFISSAPGRAAHYDLYLNGAHVVARDFGIAALPFVTKARLQLVTQTTAAIVHYYAYMHARGGRFGPDGREYLS